MPACVYLYAGTNTTEVPGMGHLTHPQDAIKHAMANASTSSATRWEVNYAPSHIVPDRFSTAALQPWAPGPAAFADAANVTGERQCCVCVVTDVVQRQGLKSGWEMVVS